MGAGSVDDVFSRTAVFFPVASQAGSIVQLVWTSQGGPCTSVSDMVDINVAVLPQVNAGPDQLICVTGTATMDATFGGSATGGVWSGFGAGVMSNVNQRKAIFTPVAAQGKQHENGCPPEMNGSSPPPPRSRHHGFTHVDLARRPVRARG